jgi:hypothetical protein
MNQENPVSIQLEHLENLKANAEIEPLSWDSFNMDGRLKQTIYPYKTKKEALKIVFRTRMVAEAAELDHLAAGDVFEHNILTLASSLVSVEGEYVPNKKIIFKEVMASDGSFDREMLPQNAEKVRRMPEHLFNLLFWFNIIFNQNVLEATSFEQLKKNSNPTQ